MDWYYFVFNFHVIFTFYDKNNVIYGQLSFLCEHKMNKTSFLLN